MHTEDRSRSGAQLLQALPYDLSCLRGRGYRKAQRQRCDFPLEYFPFTKTHSFIHSLIFTEHLLCACAWNELVNTASKAFVLPSWSLSLGGRGRDGEREEQEGDQTSTNKEVRR
jgi:hypothetical protein